MQGSFMAAFNFHLADRWFRQLLGNVENMRDYLICFTPDLAKSLIFEKARYIPTSVFTVGRVRISDQLIEIPYFHDQRGHNGVICLILEHQTNVDRYIPLRLMHFDHSYTNAKFVAWEQKASPKKRFNLNPVIPLVFHTGNKPWKRPCTNRQLMDAPKNVIQMASNYEVTVISLREYPLEMFTGSDLPFILALTVARGTCLPQKEYSAAVKKAIEKMYQLKVGEERLRQLLQFMVEWTLHKRNDYEPTDVKAIIDSKTTDSKFKEEYDNMAESTAQRLRAKGRQEGETLGIQKGRVEGRVETLRNVLQKLGVKKYGNLSDTLLQSLHSITDADQLDAMIERIDTAASWTELINIYKNLEV